MGRDERGLDPRRRPRIFAKSPGPSLAMFAFLGAVLAFDVAPNDRLGLRLPAATQSP